MKSLLAVLICFLLFVPTLTYAQTDHWIRLDSVAFGYRSVLAINDTLLLAANSYYGALHGFFRSTNTGLTWQHDTIFNSNYSVNRFRVLPDGKLYAVLTSGRIGQSTDNGFTWSLLSYTTTTPVKAIAMDSESRYFVGTDGSFSHRSLDTLQTWQIMDSTSGLYCPYVNSFLPLGSTLIAGSNYRGAFLSNDHGANWSRTSYLIASNSQWSTQINSMVFIPPNTVVAATGYFESSPTMTGGVFLTDTTCSEWVLNQFSLNGPPNDQCFLSLLFANDVLYAGSEAKGIARSYDHGANWEWVNNGLPTDYNPVHEMCVDNSGNVYAATYYGIYKLIHESSIGYNKPVFSLPSAIWIAQNFPNPFNGGTSIAFGVANPGNVTLHVFDRLGRLVATPVQSRVASGMHRIEFAMPKDAPSGAYFYRLETNGTSAVKTMMYTK